MKLGKGLATIGLSGIAITMIVCEVGPFGTGVLTILGLILIWEN